MFQAPTAAGSPATSPSEGTRTAAAPLLPGTGGPPPAATPPPKDGEAFATLEDEAEAWEEHCKGVAAASPDGAAPTEAEIAKALLEGGGGGTLSLRVTAHKLLQSALPFRRRDAMVRTAEGIFVTPHAPYAATASDEEEEVIVKVPAAPTSKQLKDKQLKDTVAVARQYQHEQQASLRMVQSQKQSQLQLQLEQIQRMQQLAQQQAQRHPQQPLAHGQPQARAEAGAARSQAGAARPHPTPQQMHLRDLQAQRQLQRARAGSLAEQPAEVSLSDVLWTSAEDMGPGSAYANAAGGAPAATGAAAPTPAEAAQPPQDAAAQAAPESRPFVDPGISSMDSLNDAIDELFPAPGGAMYASFGSGGGPFSSADLGSLDVLPRADFVPQQPLEPARSGPEEPF